MKLWKFAVIGGLVVLALVLGTTLVLAQDGDQTPTTPFGRGFVDEDGDGVCDNCGQLPGQAYGWGGMHGRGMMGAAGPGGFGHSYMHETSLIEVTASTLDMTVEDVWTELSTGISVAELAEQHNVDPQVIVDAYLAAREEALQAAVDAGQISQEQADYMLSHMAEMIADHVAEPWSANGPGAGAGFGGCHGGGPGFGGGSGFGGGRGFSGGQGFGGARQGA